MNKCDLVGDLLPQYVENLLSEDGKKFVENHLAHCPACAERARRLSAADPPENIAPDAEDMRRSLKKIKLRFRKRSTRLSAVSACLSAVTIFCAVFFPLYAQKQSVERAANAAAETLFAREMKNYLFGAPGENVFDKVVIHPAFEVNGGDASGKEEAVFTAYTADGASTLLLPAFTTFVKPRTSSIWFFLETGFEGSVYAEDTARALSRWLETSSQRPPWYLGEEMGARSTAAFSALREVWGKRSFSDAVRGFLADGKTLRADDPSSEAQDRIHIAQTFAEEFLPFLFLPDPAIHCYSFTGSVEGFAFCAPLSREWSLFLQQGEIAWNISFCFAEEAPFPSDGDGLPEFLAAVGFRSGV